jgi:hypothetical protein
MIREVAEDDMVVEEEEGVEAEVVVDEAVVVMAVEEDHKTPEDGSHMRSGKRCQNKKRRK